MQTLYCLPLAATPGWGSVLCPRAAYEHHRTTILAPTNASVFSSHSPSGHLHAVRSQHFTKLVKRLLLAAGFSSKGQSTHSFRRCGATFTATFGLSLEPVEARGYWRRHCFEQYTERDDQLREQFSKQVTANILGDFGLWLGALHLFVLFGIRALPILRNKILILQSK